MLVNHSWTKRPREALLQLDIELVIYMFRIGGSPRAPVRYHPCMLLILTALYVGQCLVGSLSGADASQKVTEAFTKVGYLGMETREIVQRQKPALLQDLPVEQSRKRNLVIRPFNIGWWKLIG